MMKGNRGLEVRRAVKGRSCSKPICFGALLWKMLKLDYSPHWSFLSIPVVIGGVCTYQQVFDQVFDVFRCL